MGSLYFSLPSHPNKLGKEAITPAYPDGHAAIAGACVTVLKACYNEAFVMPDPQVAAEDGLSLQLYTGSEPLTVGGELNKLAANVAIGRNATGVHWRSDALEGLLLADLALTYHKAFEGFSLTHFDGRLVVVGAQNSLDPGSLKLVACNSLLPYDPILLDIFSAFIVCFPLCTLAL